MAQLQELPVQLQGGARVLDAVVGFPLNVEVCWYKTEDTQEGRDGNKMVLFQPLGVSLLYGNIAGL